MRDEPGFAFENLKRFDGLEKINGTLVAKFLDASGNPLLHSIITIYIHSFVTHEREGYGAVREGAEHVVAAMKAIEENDEAKAQITEFIKSAEYMQIQEQGGRPRIQIN